MKKLLYRARGICSAFAFPLSGIGMTDQAGNPFTLFGMTTQLVLHQFEYWQWPPTPACGRRWPATPDEETFDGVSYCCGARGRPRALSNVSLIRLRPLLP
jgi:hypothetical protein